MMPRLAPGSADGPSPLSRALLLVAAALAVMSWALAAANLDKIQQTALEKFGQKAADLVGAWRKMLTDAKDLDDQGKLTNVNTFFNRRMLFENDIVVWQQNDYWASPVEFMGRGTGDCEDFSIAKYMSLLVLGVPNEKLRLVYVRARIGGPTSTKTEAHMVMGYYPNPADEPLILDNLIGNVRPASMRTDLAPVFSFNNEGLWASGQSSSSADPTARLSQWRAVLDRMKTEGF